MTKAIQKIEPSTELAPIDSRITARVVESMVLRGDISALTPEERTKFYFETCAQLGLNAASQPFAVLRLNGKEILYPTRGATDQLAAIHKLTREIVDGPKVIDVAGTKMGYAMCRATHPNGRVETAVATVPLKDPTNDLMKCETKAKRRATLSILGLGMLDESEMDTIPASRKSAATPISVTVTVDEPEELPEPLQKLVEDVAIFGSTLTLAQIRTLFTEHVATMTGDMRVRGRAVLCDVMPAGIVIVSPDFTTMLANPANEKLTMGQHLSTINAADSVRALDMLRDDYAVLPKAVQATYRQEIFTRKIQLTPTLKDLDALRSSAEAFTNAKLRAACLAAIEARAKELSPPPPPDGSDGDDRAHSDDDVERDAIQSEPESPLTAAVAKMQATHGPRHAVSHYIAHRDELPTTLQPAYRRALIDFLPYRYPNDVRTRERAESIVSDAEQGSVRRAA